MLKYLLTLLLICSYFFCSGSNKYIKISTRGKKINRNKISIYYSKEDLIKNHNYGFNNYDEATRSSIIIDGYREDTLVLKIANYIPIIFIGIKKLKEDSIMIKDLILTKYTPIDSAKYTSSIFIKKKNTYVTKTQNIKPDNFKKFTFTKGTIKVNGTNYNIELESEEFEITAYYCTPHKKSFSEETKGTPLYYVIKL